MRWCRGVSCSSSGAALVAANASRYNQRAGCGQCHFPCTALSMEAVTMDEHEAPQYQGSPELYMFLVSTAHDMKNSISVLSGTLENLLAGAMADSASGLREESGPDYTQLAQMLYQTKRLNDNLMQLLALYKDVGKPGYPFEPVANSIEELVQQVASQARILLQSRGITLE